MHTILVPSAPALGSSARLQPQPPQAGILDRCSAAIISFTDHRKGQEIHVCKVTQYIIRDSRPHMAPAEFNQTSPSLPISGLCTCNVTNKARALSSLSSFVTQAMAITKKAHCMHPSPDATTKGCHFNKIWPKLPGQANIRDSPKTRQILVFTLLLTWATSKGLKR